MQKKDFMNVRAVIALVATLALGAGLVACSSDSSSKEGNGEKKIERVVALDWRYEEILKALDVDPVGTVEIGKSEAPTTLKEQLGQATSVGQAKQPNLEVIQSLEPDLILASPTRQADIMPQLEEIAQTESYPDETYLDVLDSMDEIAAKLGKEEKAKEVRQRIEDKIAHTKDAVKPGSRAVVAGWSSEMLYTWVNPSFPQSLLSEVGYNYAFEGEKSSIESKTDVAELTGDKLPGMKADRVFMYKDVDAFKKTPYAKGSGDIVEVDQDIWSRARGPLSAEHMLDDMIAAEK